MKNIEMPTLEELQEMAAVDIRTVDKSTLAELMMWRFMKNYRRQKGLQIISSRLKIRIAINHMG